MRVLRLFFLQAVFLGDEGDRFFIVLGVDLDLDGLGVADGRVGGGGSEDAGGDAVVAEHAGENLGGHGLGELRDGLELLGVNRFHGS